MAKKQVKKPKRVWPKGKPKAKKTAPKPKKVKAPKPPRPKPQRLFDDLPALPKLDRILERMHEVREEANDLATEEKGLKQSALREMSTHKRTVYKAHGVQVTRVSGDEKLTVKLVNDDNGGQSDEDDDADDDGGSDPARDERADEGGDESGDEAGNQESEG